MSLRVADDWLFLQIIILSAEISQNIRKKYTGSYLALYRAFLHFAFWPGSILVY